jgi:hypothetical protein
MQISSAAQIGRVALNDRREFACRKQISALGAQLWLHLLCREYSAEPSLFRNPAVSVNTIIQYINNNNNNNNNFYLRNMQGYHSPNTTLYQ